MNSMSSIGWIAVVVGVILLLIALFGAQLGLGGTTFGPKHIVILVVGLVALVAGLYVALRHPSRVTP